MLGSFVKGFLLDIGFENWLIPAPHMARHASAVKRHRQSLKRQTHNRWWKSRVRTVTKEVLETSGKKDKKGTEEALKKAMSQILKAKKEGTIHSNTASRKISRLSKRLTAL
jgi:small subunit ribosomal protein S20